MSLPIVAVVGRPNVGKSTFVNRITQTGDAIVHESRGVTRDRSYHRADWNGVDFMLVDTGGIALGESDRFQHSITAQALAAAEEADCIVFLVDGRCGVTNEDGDVARVLRKASAPVLLAVNKLDDPDHEEALWDFWSLGLGEPYAVSAAHGHGTGDLLDEVVSLLPEGIDTQDDGCIDVAVIGRPNAGKSSILNCMAGQERSIVSEVSGTTRDAIDTVVEHDGTRYRIVDTAGMRKKSLIEADVEYYGLVRSLRAIDAAEVVLLVLDASVGVTDQDQRIARAASERGCGMVVLLNKIDLIDSPDAREDLRADVGERLGFVGYAPVVMTSALTGRSIGRIFEAIDAAYAGYTTQISTSSLNRLVSDLREFGHSISKGSRRLRINYVTQTATRPPVFTFFANFPEIVDDKYRRYLENRLRATFDLTGTPVRIKLKKKN